ncbi:MAG TPA: copper homeostasis protein CutC [Terriglobia bacterium]
MRKLRLEICADSVDSALAAARGGAQRIELCASLLEGGLTPSAGFIRTVRDRLPIALFVMIRPRGGDFYYSAAEYLAMKEDIRIAQSLRADGVVLGLLDPNGRVDVARTRELVELARPLEVTFHRAFDVSADLETSLENVIRTGANRILTSGGAQTAWEGLEQIRKLTQAAKDRIVIMAGSGINSRNVAKVIEATGVTEVHASAKEPVASPVRTPRSLSLGRLEASFEGYTRFVASEAEVRALAKIVSG